jgi:S-DNA-T family DNA segregation ATPase FtsK/SpoIIIE
LVLATQRPSVEIITGLIKANITSRIAFAVASQIDSRTILDSSGAEKLLGNGDMLYTSAEYNKPKRIQGAYLGEKEVKKVVEFFKVQTGAVIYNEEIVEKPKRPLGIPGMEAETGDDDPLLEEAKAEVMRAGKASASLLQRRLKVGYARAARLLDILEEKGIIGPGEGAKPREVYGVVPADEKAEYGISEEENIA